jgi:hypothetical protein
MENLVAVSAPRGATASIKKRAGGITGSIDMKDYAQNVGGGPLEKRETSQAGMPLLADLFFNRKAGCRHRGVRRSPFIGFRIDGADQVIDGRLFSYVPSPRAAFRRGGFGHR